jgi:crotonobetainyl-CoA:carnitine CoA-transferase CaiB-like acyl-CoA transferase
MVGLLSALLHARATGEGCDVDTCLFDAALHQLGYAAIWYLNENYVPPRQSRSAHFSLAPVQTVPTSDGWVFVMCLTEKFWAALLDAIARPDLAKDPRFATAKARSENRDPLHGRARSRIPQAADVVLDDEARWRAADCAGERAR